MSQMFSSAHIRIIVGMFVLNVVGWSWTIWRVTDGIATIEAAQEIQEEPVSLKADRPSPARPSRGEPFVGVGPAARLNVQGIMTPQLCPADSVDLKDDARVIGITVDGHARAYVIAAFEVTDVSRPEDLRVHVVNDMIDGRPVCITHCNLTHSTRVLTKNSVTADAHDPIDLRVGGWFNGLLLVLDGTRYSHHGANLPLDDLEFVTTTWQQWRAEHPDTLVYTGGACSG